MSSDGLIPSPFPFGQEGEWGMSTPARKFPKEAREALEDLLDEATEPIEEFGEMMLKHKLPCFDATITLEGGVVATIGFHNPAVPHNHSAHLEDLPKEIQDAMRDPAAFLKNMGLEVPPGAKVMMSAHKMEPGAIPPGMPPGAVRLPVTPQQPPDDLMLGIERILRTIYSSVQDVEVLGAIYSPHKSASLEIGKIMDAARRRDRAEILRRISDFIGKLTG